MSFDNRSSAREGNGGNSNMESQPTSLCKTGCGYYGNPAFEGLCSVCYKDKVKFQRQSVQTASLTISSHDAPSPNEPTKDEDEAAGAQSSIQSTTRVEASTESASAITPSIETGAPTVSGLSLLDKPASETDAPAADHDSGTPSSEPAVECTTASASETKDAEAAATEKPKKNRCLTCKKKVGLTGFQCRCNGLFCTSHRYSDMHDCPFNYKEMAQEQIRKNNPVVVGQKITKI